MNFKPFTQGRGLLARERKALAKELLELARKVDELEAWKARAMAHIRGYDCDHGEYVDECEFCKEQQWLLYGDAPSDVTISPGKISL